MHIIFLKKQINVCTIYPVMTLKKKKFHLGCAFLFYQLMSIRIIEYLTRAAIKIRKHDKCHVSVGIVKLM